MMGRGAIGCLLAVVVSGGVRSAADDPPKPAADAPTESGAASGAVAGESVEAVGLAPPGAETGSGTQLDADSEHAPAGSRGAVDRGPHSAYTQSRRSAEVEASFGLAGDLWGLRRDLADLGIDFGAQLTLDNAWNVTGGTSTGSIFMSLLDVNFGVRTEPLLDWKGGRFYISMLSYSQSRESYELVGDFWGWDAIISGVGSVTQLAELWYEQEFFDKMLTLRFGKQDANSTFAAVPGAGSFISSASTYPGTIVWYLPTYARQAMGVDLIVQPTDWLTGRVGWFDGSSNYYDAERGSVWPNTGTRGPKSFFDNPGSWFFITELDAKWTLADTSLPGSAQIGYWWQTGPVAFDVSSVPGFTGPSSVYVTDGSEGLYLGASQAVFSFAGDAQASRRVSLFSQLGFGDGASNPATFSLISGVTATGMIPGRDNDQCGVQFNYARFSNDDRVWPYPGTDQLALELFYRVQVTPAFAVQPDVQWIRNPNGQPDVDDALLLTLRVQLAF